MYRECWPPFLYAMISPVITARVSTSMNTVCFHILVIRNLETMHDLYLNTLYMRALQIIWKRTRTMIDQSTRCLSGDREPRLLVDIVPCTVCLDVPSQAFLPSFLLVYPFQDEKFKDINFGKAMMMSLWPLFIPLPLGYPLRLNPES